MKLSHLVANLIDGIKKLFRTSKKVRKTPIPSQDGCPDNHVKIGYTCPDEEEAPLWNEFWRINVPRKILICIWNAVHDALPTAQNLVQRKITVKPHCLRCNQELVEDTEHLFFNCDISRQIWRASLLRLDFEESASFAFKDWFWGWMKSAPDEEAIKLSFYILWHIWNSRNSSMFIAEPLHIHYLLQHAYEDLRSTDREDARIPLQEQTIVQIDGAFWAKSGHASAAWSIRQGIDDSIITNGVSHFSASSALHTEIMACFLGVKEAHQRHLSNIIIKSDSQMLQWLLSNSKDTPQWELYTLIHDLKFLCSAFPFVTCIKVSKMEVHPETAVANSTRCNVCSRFPKK